MSSQSNIDKIRSKITNSQNISQNQVPGDVHSTLVQNNTEIKKPKFEETHSREHIWVRNELKATVNNHSKNRGDKTKLYNQALEEYFEKRGIDYN